MSDSSPLITTDELLTRLGDPRLRLVDASWHLDGRDGRVDFAAARLPGAVFFDLEAASDQASPLPHMLPAPEAFAAYVGALGVADRDDIVVYDTLGLVSAARVWWMFRIMGADRVRVLDGGLPGWRARGLPLDAGPAAVVAPAVFKTRFDARAVAVWQDAASAAARGEQILDARSAARFSGAAPEPRKGLRGGHMPDARNLPFADILTADSTMKRGDDLRAAFIRAGVDLDSPVLTTCGSGVTAAILSLGLAELGYESRLYDGSWTEWGGRTDTEVVTGEA